jgi:hypothetical protein
VERPFFWPGDWMNRLHRRYGWAYSVAVFCVVWLALTVAVHFGPGDLVGPFHWAGAVMFGLVCACICTLMAELFSSGR